MRLLLRLLTAVSAVAAATAQTTAAELCPEWHVLWIDSVLWEWDYVPNQVMSQFSIASNETLGDRNLLREKAQNCTAAVIRVRENWSVEDYDVLKLEQALSHTIHFYILIGEEMRSCVDAEFYAVAPLVVRNFWHADCEQYDNVMVVPLGTVHPAFRHYGRGSEASPSLTPLSRRNFTWSFLSAHRTSIRDKIIEIFLSTCSEKEEEEDEVVCLRQANHYLEYPGQMPGDEYARVLADSTFGLTPSGAVHDTWRLQEVLASGAIPVVTVKPEYFASFMPRSLADKFVYLDFDPDSAFFDNQRIEGHDVTVDDQSVTNAHQRIASLLQDKETLDQHSAALYAEFQAHTDQWQQNVFDMAQRLTLPPRDDSRR
mmetsp:Transcript_18330/g.56225  ORF Transcript_18330/g.56225 Transcript_18330/m.56225 type:complete len:371 (+) Transcript_18330:65-1177(+)